jgi:hypothetical protein
MNKELSPFEASKPSCNSFVLNLEARGACFNPYNQERLCLHILVVDSYKHLPSKYHVRMHFAHQIVSNLEKTQKKENGLIKDNITRHIN